MMSQKSKIRSWKARMDIQAVISIILPEPKSELFLTESDTTLG